MNWKEVLQFQIISRGEITEEVLTGKVKSAIEIGAEWLDKQVTVSPEIRNLCVEFISGHIIRRIKINEAKCNDSSEGLMMLLLADELEDKGVNISEISRKILGLMSGFPTDDRLWNERNNQVPLEKKLKN